MQRYWNDGVVHAIGRCARGEEVGQRSGEAQVSFVFESVDCEGERSVAGGARIRSTGACPVEGRRPAQAVGAEVIGAGVVGSSASRAEGIG